MVLKRRRSSLKKNLIKTMIQILNSACTIKLLFSKEWFSNAFTTKIQSWKSQRKKPNEFLLTLKSHTSSTWGSMNSHSTTRLHQSSRESTLSRRLQLTLQHSAKLCRFPQAEDRLSKAAWSQPRTNRSKKFQILAILKSKWWRRWTIM